MSNENWKGWVPSIDRKTKIDTLIFISLLTGYTVYLYHFEAVIVFIFVTIPSLIGICTYAGKSATGIGRAFDEVCMAKFDGHVAYRAFRTVVVLFYGVAAWCCWYLKSSFFSSLDAPAEQPSMQGSTGCYNSPNENDADPAVQIAKWHHNERV